jgi:uncharacterized membrane protein
MTRSVKPEAATISKDPVARLAERQHWISPIVEEALQNSVSQAIQCMGGNSLRYALHADWLHEPLHAILTDVPVGSWTATIAFDSIAALSSSSKLDSAADAAVVVGLIGAAGAAVTGLNDWSEIREPAARKIGLIHAVLNVAAVGLFASSCIARSRRARTSGRALAAIGYLVVSASAHLGGNLVYEHGIGVAPRAGDSNVTRDLQS